MLLLTLFGKFLKAKFSKGEKFGKFLKSISKIEVLIPRLILEKDVLILTGLALKYTKMIEKAPLKRKKIREKKRKEKRKKMIEKVPLEMFKFQY